jgi:hypothetical protein
MIRSTQPTTELLNDVWIEGGAVIDIDRRHLCLWSGEEYLWSVRLRDLWLSFLPISWEGWTIQWAQRGVIDLAEHAGLDPAPLIQMKSDDVPFDPKWIALGIHLGPSIGTFVTVRRRDGSLHDVHTRLRPSNWLNAGPALADLLEARKPDLVPSESAGWPRNFIFIDVPAQRLWVSEPLRGARYTHLEAWTCSRWPGWDVNLHLDGMPFHLRLAGRDPIPLQRPIDDHIRTIAEMVQGADTDPVALSRAIQLPFAAEGQVIVHPHFLDPHRVGIDRSARVDRFLDILNRWRKHDDKS